MDQEVQPSSATPSQFMTRTRHERRTLGSRVGDPAPHGELLLAALSYGAGEWPVFPVAGVVDGVCRCRRGRSCTHAGKHPLTAHGLRDASTNAAVIQEWWRRWPWANVGLATGSAPTGGGVVVVDVDLPKGGQESLAVVKELGLELPGTLTARTGGGGLHLLYRHPGVALGNTAGALPGVERPLPGIDLRADGGYIVAPPSAHRSGGGYEWVDVTVDPAPALAWLRPAVRRLAGGDGLRGPVTQGGSRYGLSALCREVEALVTALEGERNNRLNRAAWSLGMLVAGGELEEHTVVEELRQAAAIAGLDSRETEATIASGLAAGVERPRRRPER